MNNNNCIKEAKNSIEDEAISAKDNYCFKKDENGKPIISFDNVARAEAMILNDSSYKNSSNPEKGPSFYKKNTCKRNSDKISHSEGSLMYGGSTAYWAVMLRECLNNELTEDKKGIIEKAKKAMPVDIENNCDYKTIIFYLVSAIDRENSTHLNADNVGRIEISNALCGTEISKKNLIDLLKKPRNEYKVISLLSKRTSRGRENFSFATKFCHYASFYLFSGDNEQDNFSIYDNVMCKAIRDYDEKFTEKNNGETYAEFYGRYIDTIDAIRNKYSRSGGLVSRNGFDHLLWYYYKGQ